MNDIFDQENSRETARKAAKLRMQLHRKDVQELFAQPQMRRVLSVFLEDSGIDSTVFRDNANAMAHAAGWHDAGRWWLAQVRTHCPEREPQMRKEQRIAAPDTNEDE